MLFFTFVTTRYIHSFLCFILVIFGAGFLLACSSDSLDPKELPYTLEEAFQLGERAQAVDLDGDGVDEIVKREYAPNALLLADQGGRVIEQVNYAGQLTGPVFIRDYQGDGTSELLVPFQRNDSLFVSFVDARGQKLFHLFLVDGEPRHEDNSTLPWDPDIKGFYLRDVDGNGREELVTVMMTAYARLPRGVLVHRLPNGQLLGKKIVGGLPEKNFLDDFDGDGFPEVVVGTFAANNGAEAGGFDDQHTYMIVFSLHPQPEVSWSRKMGGKWNMLRLWYDDFDGEGQNEFLAFMSMHSSKPEGVRLELVEPGTWTTYQQLTLSEPLVHPQVVDLDRDTHPEILTIREPGAIWVFNHQFDVIRRQRIASTLWWLQVVSDLDGDGIEEIAAITPNNEVLLLGPDLGLKASFAAGALEDGHAGYTVQGVMRRGTGVAPYLLVEKEGKVIALEMVPNPWSWFYRYGVPALWILGIVLVGGLAFGVRKLYQRKQLLEQLQATAFNVAAQGVLVIDPQGRIVLINTTLCDWLALDTPGRIEGVRYDDAFDWIPPLVSFLHETLTRDTRSYDTDLSVEVNGMERTFHVTVEPIFPNSPQRPYWLVSFQPPSAEAAALDAKTWAMMARKVTHDIKNPLTNILLTTQRLQSEVRKRVPQEADALDPYAERILDRVTHLRQLTKQFMKILDVDALDLVKTDPVRLVREVAETIKPDLPPDVDLATDVPADLPGVLLDSGQIRTVLENLVSNAIHALPQGGTITLSAYETSGLRSSQTEYAPTDYVVIEVQDNGVGISPDDQARLFEPGFTTSEFGTGLGLALVKRVVEQHSGFIEVESKPGIGSIFSIHLPVANHQRRSGGTP